MEMSGSVIRLIVHPKTVQLHSVDFFIFLATRRKKQQMEKAINS